MFSIRLLCKCGLFKTSKVPLRSYASFRDPFTRTWNIMTNDLRKKKEVYYPSHADIVIIGGGFIGSSVAYWIKNKAGPGLSVIVLDKDLGCNKPENSALLGTLSQHYSLPENIYLAQHSAEFFRNIKEHLGTDVDIQYSPYGRLVLASEKYAERLQKNVSIQNEHGTYNEILTTDEIRQRYPWIDITDIKLGCISSECDGAFNSAQFLKALRKKSEELGAVYINAEVVGFGMEHQRDVLMEGIVPGSYQKITNVAYKTADDNVHILNFAVCVVAAGTESANVAKLARIGTETGLLTVPLPIEKREYNVYSIENSSNSWSIGLNTPFIMDTSGLWFRRNRLDNNLLCGHIPYLEGSGQPTQDEISNLIQPSLENRFPGFKNIKIKHLGTEVHDCNTYDDSGIVGPHIYHGTLFFATGFGIQGCQHAPGIGRAIAEMIIDGSCISIDLTRFGFDRLLTDYPMIEFNVY